MTSDRLTMAQVVLLGTYAVGMASGQVLFKLAAQRFPASAEVGEQLTSLLGNTYFFVAFAFYCALAICWARHLLGLDSDLHPVVARLSLRRARLRDHANARRVAV